MHFAGGSKCRWSVHKEGDPYANQAAFCQQLEMQMEAANAADVAQAFRVCAFRSVPVPFPFRSSFCVRAGVPCFRKPPYLYLMRVVNQAVTSVNQHYYRQSVTISTFNRQINYIWAVYAVYGLVL